MNFLKAVSGIIKTNGLAAPVQPKYTVTKEHSDYEERHYEPMVWVSSTIRTTVKKNPAAEGFMKCLRYLEGNNDQKKTLYMTIPVIINIELLGPSTDPETEIIFTTSFFLNESLFEDGKIPQPTEEDVYIQEIPAMDIFVRRFGGFARGQAWVEENDKLMASLEEADKECLEEKPQTYSVGYDPPFKLMNRRNECWIVKKSQHVENTAAGLEPVTD
ncbi:heme-binding protein 2-like [Tubulanus polymorphus]|uniref:heme-binding protein 2-like n=1 Tax=Tubulanus polymorphus TaxID=672921 RepID=UPI003DA400D2